MVKVDKTTKYCSLYANEMHLIVMLIPYIERELEKGKKITTVLEDGLEDEVHTFIKNVSLGKSKKNKIKKINWEKNLLSEEQLAEIRNKTILVQGSYDYVESINRQLGNNKNIKIINCFNIEDFEENSREILENHDAILNTLGVKKITEMFKVNKTLKGILTK